MGTLSDSGDSVEYDNLARKRRRARRAGSRAFEGADAKVFSPLNPPPASITAAKLPRLVRSAVPAQL